MEIDSWAAMVEDTAVVVALVLAIVQLVKLLVRAVPGLEIGGAPKWQALAAVLGVAIYVTASIRVGDGGTDIALAVFNGVFAGLAASKAYEVANPRA